MYVCMYVCTYVRMYSNVYICMYVCMLYTLPLSYVFIYCMYTYITLTLMDIMYVFTVYTYVRTYKVCINVWQSEHFIIEPWLLLLAFRDSFAADASIHLGDSGTKRCSSSIPTAGIAVNA